MHAPRLGLRALPLNVQSLILSFLPALRPPGPAPRGAARFSSSVSLLDNNLKQAAATPAFFAQATSPSLEPELEQHGSVFEVDSDEYNRVPLSKIDVAITATPRTPGDSLLSLLASRSYAEAHKLLAELRASGQTIEPRYGFAREAERAVAGGGEGGDQDWIEWWELAPGVTDSVHVDVQNLRTEDALMARRATRIANRLFQSLAAAATTVEASAPNPAVDYALLERFATILCRQGHTRVVAEHVLVRLATYAPPEYADRIWTAALSRHVAEHGNTSFRVSGSYLGYRTRPVRAAEARVGVAERKRREAHRLESRTESTLLWYLNRQHEAYRSLVRARGRMVLAQAHLGRHDLAVALIEEQHQVVDGARIKLSNETYLSLLRILAAANAFPLFERTLEVLYSHQRRLLRVPASHRAGVRMPYFVRAAGTFQHEPEPTPVEAFSTFRYQHVVSTIEEGEESLFEKADEAHDMAPNEISFEEEDSAALGRAATRTGRRRSRELVSLVSEGRLADATHLVGRVLLGGPLPSSNALASYLDAARIEAASSERVGLALHVLERQAWKRSERRAWWSTAEMLAAVKQGRYRDAFIAYKRTFAIAALSRSARRAVWLATRRMAAARPAQIAGGSSPSADLLLVPSPYTVSILLQALVPHLRTVAEQGERDARPGALDSADRLIDEIYAEVVAANELKLWSSGSAAAIHGKQAPSTTTTPSSHLDPYTFIPFLRDRLATHAPAPALLQILADMSRLGIQPQPPHYAIVLHALAKQGGKVPPGSRIEAQRAVTADLAHVLSLFEGAAARNGRQSLFESTRASPSVRALTTDDEGRLLLPTEPLSLHAYTGVLRGLRERGASAIAGEIMARLAEPRSAEIVRWIEEDEQFRDEMRRLKREGVL
ncbi:hypothetical protein C6P46_002851 [Rhodotorula mucilaginosa]|jgi:hypothetical protein|uniref:Proteophosphoglycan 5 n=1 Tax=Rhodotorula mucilaginosa TaxID=5537 RepID=A0A9P6W5M6_RHOMI|nr:hypothetical protein C6P46_002851 [Rhodotorula mucilaginosa]